MNKTEAFKVEKEKRKERKPQSKKKK